MSEGAASPIRVVITGVAGRMGSTLARMVHEAKGMSLVGATEHRGSPAVGGDAGVAARIGRLGIDVAGDLGAALSSGSPNVVIDFTSAEASVEHARICAERGVALVVGSTGFTAETKAALARHAQRVPMVVSPNMSIGMNLVIRAAAELAQRLGEGFDVEIVEAHHRMKKDAPSGTALRMAEEIARATRRGSDDLRMARQGQVGARPAREIGIQAVRGGDVVGDHTVYFLGDGERVELTHRASSRDQFARGALRAARWIVGRAPGQYDMDDVLGVK
ncbi:MAG TPA: 4-hydroxy-tetrahydrodipicolinate reductase [Myxococcaceae bacterium]|nr:4-hydroxy-tetrahydrodipicolinate reductase [Myxococcaceae bacterium]